MASETLKHCLCLGKWKSQGTQHSPFWNRAPSELEETAEVTNAYLLLYRRWREVTHSGLRTSEAGQQRVPSWLALGHSTRLPRDVECLESKRHFWDVQLTVRSHM